MDTRLVETALRAFAEYYKEDAELLVSNFRRTGEVLTCFEPLGTGLGLMCGYEDEAPEVPEGVDQACMVVIVKRDHSAATLAGIATLEVIRSNTGPWSDPRIHAEARRQYEALKMTPTKVPPLKQERGETGIDAPG